MTEHATVYATKEEFSQLEASQLEIRDELEHLSKMFYDTVENMKAGGGPPTEGSAMDAANISKISNLSERVNDIENKLNKMFKVVYPSQGNILEQLNALQDQVDYCCKQVITGELPPESPHKVVKKSSDQNLTEAAMKDIEGLPALYETIESMQNQLHQVHEIALQIAAEKEDRQINMNALVEQIELLKIIKLDREDMVQALLDKADLRTVARKVSHDHFETTCDDLSKGLEKALGKLDVQESLWQQALDDIQREIACKLDKIELHPVKEYFSNKLMQLQEGLRKLSQMRQEAEAAGTKKKLFSNVNCMSCDAKAFMNKELTEGMPPKPFVPTKSIKPYLTYELDAIRKVQMSGLSQKAEKEMPSSKHPQETKSEPGKLSNRYCGGSHTMTTAAQRIGRSGNFVQQWGPEVLPIPSGFTTGKDGRMYKVSVTEGVSVGPGGAIDAPCTPKPSAKKSEKAVPTPNIQMVAECRCLDDVLPPRK